MRAFLFLIALAASPFAAALEPGAALPDPAAVRLGESQPFSLQALKGRVVYVDFWASWCLPCKLSMPILEEMQKKHGARGFTVVGVNKDATAADAKRFLARVPVSFVLLADEKDAIARAFDVKAMPSGYLVDRRGVVRRVHRGFNDGTAAMLEKEVEELLREPA